MKAAPRDQLRLLDLQELDTSLNRLAHRRRTLPELAELAALEGRIGELRDKLVRARTDLADLDREQAKAEQDVDQVRARADRDRKRLDSGLVTSAKDLSSLQSEITSLERRQSDLEEVVLEIMERREEAEARVTAVEAEQRELDVTLTDLNERKAKAEQEISGQSGLTTDARKGVAADIPGDLLALYEKLREQFDGVAAAALTRGQCQGCRLALNTSDLNRIRAAAADDIVRCEECRRILVRTPESGL
ncbi:C4-type zinc ribbon domain-containing protein [Actinocorallia sp. API 0066]|uniref:zinc ribbon domain-containing protein n=1 Tax=Actinocorallia sp. API 0066 TaxID=2896846 RepID=UPI001E2DB0AE|nr:C4-type zinc ribbon domain-containing protein [Actinocorallia sp. API 0066]MCD0451929.1 C4-type zinc ribbon domain-containing protein [Actinocorallia sp. API 0066]